jgi:hypothetical protein
VISSLEDQMDAAETAPPRLVSLVWKTMVNVIFIVFFIIVTIFIVVSFYCVDENMNCTFSLKNPAGKSLFHEPSQYPTHELGHFQLFTD